MLSHYLKSFKAYDIRGVYQTEIDTTLVYVLGRAIAKFIQKQYGQDSKFVLGYDVRPANQEIIPFFVAGMHEVGFDNITNIGMCSTTISYYIGQGAFDLSVNFTASHNPPEYLGMKFFDKDTVFLSQDQLQDLFTQEYNQLTQNSQIIQLPTTNQDSQTEKIPKKAFFDSKISQLFSFLDNKYDQIQSKSKFVVDFSNGAASQYEKQYFQQLQAKGRDIVFLNDTPDGTFPNHLSDTQDHENYQQCLTKVREVDADFGIMFDGDADRLGFVLPDGDVVGGDILLAILAKQVIGTKSNGFFSFITNIFASKPKVIYEVMCSKSIKEEVNKLGGEAILHKMGRFFIKEKMDSVGAVLGGETSGHFMFREIGGYEMPLLALSYIAQELQSRPNFQTMISNYKKYPKSPVYSKEVANKDQTIQNIKNKYSDFNQETIDGISIFGDEFWFNVRCSNTENKIRYTLEADDDTILARELSKLQEIL